MIRLVPLMCLLACTRTAGSFSLEDGTEISVGDDGSIALVIDGAETFALSDRPPQVRTFDESSEGPFAIWSFERDDERRVPLNLDRVRRDGEQVLVDYVSAGSRTATLAIEATEAGTRFTFAVEGDEADSIAIPVRCDEGGSFHGFGEQYSTTNLKGESFRLLLEEQGVGRQEDGFRPVSGDRFTTYFPMPWWLDMRGHGVLFETAHRVETDLCSTDSEVAWIEVVDGSPVSWTVFHGPTPLDVIRQLGDVVGRPKLPPAWAWGTWICTQGGEEAVRAQADFLEQSGIDATALWVQDWSGVAQNIDGGYGVNYRWEADTEELYPNLGALVDEMHGRGLKVFAYVNPFVDPTLPNHFDEMAAAGLLPSDPNGEPYLFSSPRARDMSMADLTNPDTRDYVKTALVAAIEDYGLDGWMADFGEWLPLDAQVASGQDPVEAHNTYPLQWHSVVRDAWEEARPDGDWVSFARSGYTGVQEHAMIHWVGDQEADDHVEDGLPTVVPAMLTMSMAAQPHVTHDIAGFSGGPSTRELYLRWTELGAFSPFMRTHDGNNRANNWRFDADTETTEHFRRFSAIHDLLAPELMALAEEAQSTSAPIVRHLALQYPEDRETWDVHDQFLLGPDLLVAPVVREGLVEREVYFPEGTWFDVWTGEAIDGGQRLSIDAPIGRPPVFHRETDRTDIRGVP